MADVLTGHPLARAVLETVRAALTDSGPVEVRFSKSQVALRRACGFAYIWVPGRYLKNPAAEAVLSIALPRRVDSSRFKQVAHPSPKVWMHHLEIGSVKDVDAEVIAWLREAAAGSAVDRQE